MLCRGAIALFDPSTASSRVVQEAPSGWRVLATAGRRGVAWEADFERVSARSERGSVKTSTELGRALAHIPFSVAGASWVLEVEANIRSLQQTLLSLEALTQELVPSFELALLRERSRVVAGAYQLESVIRATHDPVVAAKLVSRFMADTFKAPIAIWMALEYRDDLRFAAAAGCSVDDRRTLRSSFETLGSNELMMPGERDARSEQLSIAFGRPIDTLGSDVVMLATSIAPADRETMHVVGTFLVDRLTALAAQGRDDAVQRHMDLGVAVTAHELRGPLLGVQIALATILRSSKLSASDADLLRRAHREVLRTANEIKRLLDSASGANALEPRDADLAALVADAVNAASIEAGVDGVNLRSPGPIPIRVDVPSLRHAVTNIVRNALSYSDGSPVSVAVASDGTSAQIHIRDSGPGVPAAERRTIFDPFVRGRSGAASNGHGLGLFLARRVVEAHNGKLRVHSTTSGTTFSIRLPLGSEGLP
ncbi:MAG: HAMP domain-containing sensor histidine kinase [Actinomycetota bacterium]